MASSNPANFANRPTEEVREISSKGGNTRSAGNQSTDPQGRNQYETEMTSNTNPGNFANRPTEEVQEIASAGGHASRGHGSAATNPANFANRPTEEVREIAAKGGHASHGPRTTEPSSHASDTTEDYEYSGSGGGSGRGFASMDPERMREIASKGGRSRGGQSEVTE